MPKQRIPAYIRALDKTLVGEGCWEYQGKIGNHGYGMVYISTEPGTRRDTFRLAHRVVVMHRGHQVAEFKHGEATAEDIVAAASGLKQREAGAASTAAHS